MKAIWNIFAGSFRTHIRLTLVRPTFQITLVAQPIVMAVLAYMIYQHTGHTNDFFSFVVLGAGMAGMWSSIIFSSAGDINRERFYGTLGPLVGAPASLLLIMLGKIAANGLLSTLSFVISFVFSASVLHVPLDIPHPFAFGLSLMILLIATNLFALMLSSLFLISRATTVLQNFLEYPILIVTGVFFPLEALPLWLQPLGWPIPLTWGAKLLRWTAQAQWDVNAFGKDLAIELSLVLCYLLLSFVLFRLIEYRIRVTASMEIY